MSRELPERQAILLDDDFLKNIVEENMETKWKGTSCTSFYFPHTVHLILICLRYPALVPFQYYRLQY